MKQWIEAPNGAVIFYTTILGFLIGVFAYSFGTTTVFVPAILLAIAVVHIAAVLWWKVPPRTLIAALFCASVALGCLRVLLVPDVYRDFTALNEKKVSVVGHIVKDPERREKTTHITVLVETIEGKRADGLLLIIAERLQQASYGDKVIVEGRLELPEAFTTQTGKEFDYASYLRAKGIGATMTRPQLIVEKGSDWSMLGTLYSIKHAFERSIERIMPEPAAGLLQGILLGNRDALGERWYEIFILAGLVHIVVLSGYNLSIIADSTMRLFSKVSRRWALIFGACGVVAFALMVGAEATVIRATIMALIVIIGRALRRPHALLRALSIACVLMVLHNPLILTSDPSFILSFLATFGLITLGTSFENTLQFIPERFGMRGITAATFATQVFVLPALIFYTGRLSLIALPANLIVLPLVPAAMLFGFIAGAAGLLSEILGMIVMVPAWLLLSVITTAAKMAASIPGASFSVAGLQTPFIFGLYVVIVPLSLWAYHTYFHREKAQIGTEKY